MPCQDAFHFAEVSATEGSAPTYVLAVADGAGSRRRSGEGADHAVRVGTQAVERLLAAGPCPAGAADWGYLAGEAFRDAHRTLLGLFRAYGDPADFATTLTLAILHRHYVAWAAVGDCFLVVRAKRGLDASFALVDLEPKSRYGAAADETAFVTSDRCLETLRNYAMDDPRVTGVLLSTDGLESPFVRNSGRDPQVTESIVRSVMEYFDEQPQQPDAALGDFLYSPQFRQYTQDDKTIVVAVSDDDR
ncbi:protein phosphatase 2C domain-containing protein [Frankia sp. AgB32]|nr:protein phosphatase 2C domain-containing protein [Frankia sp. AgB32]